jgi:hypothetical protein
MATYNDICVRVRSLLDDVPGAIYTNTFILPLINHAQGIIASELASAGVQEVRATVVYSGSTVVPAGMVAMTYSSTPALPANLIAPDRLMERKAVTNAPTVAIAAGGSVTNGAHLCAVAFTCSFGTTPPMTVATVTAGGGNNTINWSGIALGPTGTTGRILCRSKAGATVLYVDQTLSDNTTTTATSTGADSSLTVLADLTGPTVGTEEGTWIPMRGARPLPGVAQTSQLLVWDWDSHKLLFVGSTEDRDVKMDYWTTVSDFTGTSGETLPLLDTLDILAPLTAGLAAQSRGQAQMASLYGVVGRDGVSGIAGRLLENFINTTIKTQQSEPQRRAPYAGILRYPAYQAPVWKY